MTEEKEGIVNESNETANREEPWIVANLVNEETGEKQAVTMEKVLETVDKKENESGLEQTVNSSYSVINEYEGYSCRLAEIDVHPQRSVIDGSNLVTLYLDETETAFLRPGRYFVLFHELLRMIRNGVEEVDGFLITTDTGLLEGTGLKAWDTINAKALIHLTEENERIDDLEMWLVISEATEAPIKFHCLFQGIVAQAAINLTLGNLQKSGGLTIASSTEGSKPTISITTKPIDKADFPIDKINSNVWKLLEGVKSGQYGFTWNDEFYEVDEETGIINVGINVASGTDKRKSKAVPVTYCIDFSELEGSITKKLEPYDKRVCIAVAALYNMGYEVMTLQQIYNAMGNRGKIGSTDKKKLNDSITKLGTAILHLDNRLEADVYNRYEFIYDGAVIIMERVQALVNGQIAESAIHVFREPAPISFAKERKQFTTIEVRLFDSPISKTSTNIQLEDYLIERISKIKRSSGKTSNKILFDTIYKQAGITEKKQKQRAPKKIEKLLEHYKNCSFIKGYSIESDGIKIYY